MDTCLHCWTTKRTGRLWYQMLATQHFMEWENVAENLPDKKRVSVIATKDCGGFQIRSGGGWCKSVILTKRGSQKGLYVTVAISKCHEPESSLNDCVGVEHISFNDVFTRAHYTPILFYRKLYFSYVFKIIFC